MHAPSYKSKQSGDKKLKKSRSRSPKDKRKQSSSSPTDSKKNNRAKLAGKMAQQDQQKQHAIFQQLGYTNTDNPFGDKNLTQQFLWHKNSGQVSKKLKTQDEIELEIEQIKKKREEREKEKLILQDEKDRHQRLKENENFQVWLEKEQQIQRDQNRIRGLIRLGYQTEKSMDKLILKGKFPHSFRFETIMVSPRTYLQSLTDVELDIILQDSKQNFQMNLERTDSFNKYWDAIIALCNDVREQKKTSDEQTQDQKLANTNLGGPEFEEEVKMMFEGKNSAELEKLQKEIENELNNKECFGVMDYEYWEQIIKKLKLQIAEVQLQEFYLTFEKNIKRESEVMIVEGMTAKDIDKQQPVQEDLEEVENYELNTIKEPKLLPMSDFFVKNSITQEENFKWLKEKREKVYIDLEKKTLEKLGERIEQIKKQPMKNKLAYTEDRYMDEDDPLTTDGIQHMIELYKNKPLEEGEEIFDDQIDIPKMFSDENSSLKKPQYFNRVKMGYDWNKYNQMHYDEENPPNMVIMGYKFNIFYPEKLQRMVTPKYWLEECAGEPNFMIIRFSAGPPYEDLQFKVLNREWEMSDRFGFKCVFNRGVLHLYFNFKKIFYKR